MRKRISDIRTSPEKKTQHKEKSYLTLNNNTSQEQSPEESDAKAQALTSEVCKRYLKILQEISEDCKRYLKILQEISEDCKRYLKTLQEKSEDYKRYLNSNPEDSDHAHSDTCSICHQI